MGRTLVAQISNLLYRRLAVGRPFARRDACGLKIRDTADWKSALLWLRLRRAVEYLEIFSARNGLRKTLGISSALKNNPSMKKTAATN